MPPSSPSPFSTMRSARVRASMSRAEGSHSCTSSPLGMAVVTVNESPARSRTAAPRIE